MFSETDPAQDIIFPREFLSGTRINRILEERYEELIKFRRDVHQHPEISWNEFRTTEKIAAALKKTGLKPQYVGETGIFVDIGEGPIVVAFRGDIDALPIQEETGLPFSSSIDGVCHACGHDIHLTVALGVAFTLARLDCESPLGARVRVIFQPAEEKIPGGAREMIEEGVLHGVARIFALHCDPRSDVGSIAVSAGATSSASDVIRVSLYGRGGHTSRPHLTEDIVFALAGIATQVPALVSRRTDTRDGVSVVWGEMHAGSAPNAIPAQGYLAGTVRCLKAEAWQHAGGLINEVIAQVAAAYQVRAEVEHVRGVPPVVNTAAEAKAVEHAARAELGVDRVVVGTQSMGGEDFGWMLQKVPGAMFRLGTGTPGGKMYDLHRGDYVVDERAIAVGAAVVVRTVLECLEKPVE